LNALGAAARAPAGRRVRAFFAAWPEPSWCRSLLTATATLRDAGRWLLSDDLHVTLRFLGGLEPRQLDVIRREAAQLSWRPFTLRFSRVEWWRDAQVLAAVAPQLPEAAAELVGSLAAAARQAGIASDLKPFRPHVTLARRVSAQSGALPPLALDLAVTTFCLASSDTRAEGACYTVLDRWPSPPH
jgi:2'-5' RNA ligase